MKIRAATNADLPALELFSARYNRPLSSTFQQDFFDWQYSNATSDNKSVFVAFDDDGALVGYCSGRYQRTWYSDKEILGVWLHEWFVNPEASGVGFRLLDAVTRNAQFVAVSGGSVDTMNVFLRLTPNVVWFELSRLMAILTPLACYKLLPRGENASSLDILKALQLRVRENVQVTEFMLPSFGRETDIAWAEMIATTGMVLGTCRDSTTMNWRYRDHPRFSYRRVLFQSSAGNAILVWRIELVKDIDGDIQVARLCEVVGSPSAVASATPAFLRRIKIEGVAFCDFFSSHVLLLDALVNGGMRSVVSTPYLDIARLFSPLQFDTRRTINMACYIRSPVSNSMFSTHNFLFTKGDGIQDRPNP